MDERYVLYTDGSCLGNPGPGGWAAVMLLGKKEVFRKTGGAPDTTNNRMELMAVITGLSAVDPGSAVEVHSDSKYVIDAFEKGWVKSWRSKGWTRNGEALKNVDLWMVLEKIVSKRTVTWVWVKGHNGNQYNELCDQMAVSTAQAYQQNGELAARIDPVEGEDPLREEPVVAESNVVAADGTGTADTPMTMDSPAHEEAGQEAEEQLWLPVEETNEPAPDLHEDAPFFKVGPSSQEIQPVFVERSQLTAHLAGRDMSALAYLEDFIARSDKEKTGVEHPCGGNAWCDYCPGGAPVSGECSCAKAYILFVDSKAVEE